MELLTLIFIQAIISAVFSGIVASAKKQETGLWVIAGFVFGIFGLIASAGMPSRLPQPINTSNSETRQTISPIKDDEPNKDIPPTPTTQTTPASKFVGMTVIILLIIIAIASIIFDN